jgi:hypothetical protein
VSCMVEAPDAASSRRFTVKPAVCWPIKSPRYRRVAEAASRAVVALQRDTGSMGHRVSCPAFVGRAATAASRPARSAKTTGSGRYSAGG